MSDKRFSLLRLVCCAMALVLLFGLLAPGVPSAQAASSELMFTSVNDQPIFPMDNPYIALKYSDGSILVPHRLLTDSEIGAKVEYSAPQRYVTLTYEGSTVTFEIGSRTAFDSNGNTFDTRVMRYISDAGTYYYFDLSFLKSYFGWSSWTIKTEYGHLLRIKTQDNLRTDMDFLRIWTNRQKELYEAYYGPINPPTQPPRPSVAPTVSDSPAPTPTPELPPVPQIPLPVEEEPLGVYLTFDGPMNEFVEPIIDLLEAHGFRGAFFLELEGLETRPDLLRRLTATHTLGLCGIAGPEDIDGLMDELNRGIYLADQAAFVKPRLVRQTTLLALSGNREFTAQPVLDRLAESGYRLWGWTIEAGDRKEEARAARVSQRIINTLPSSKDGPAVIRFGLNQVALDTLALLLPELSDSQRYYVRAMSVLDRPINGYWELR